MYKRTMIKITGRENGVSIRTMSRAFRSPHEFIVLRKELERLEKEKYVIVKDILSFAELWYCEDKDHKKSIRISFWWMNDVANDKYSVKKETISFSYDALSLAAQQPGAQQKLLSDSMWMFPKIEFRSRKNLKEILGQPALKHKFVKFLETRMYWRNYERIVLYDDFMPYSFAFDGYTPYGLGICGGIILHGQEKMETAYYSIHT